MNTKQTYSGLHKAVLNTRGISRSDVPRAGWMLKYLEFHLPGISNDEWREESSCAPTRFLSRCRRACHSESFVEYVILSPVFWDEESQCGRFLKNDKGEKKL